MSEIDAILEGLESHATQSLETPAINFTSLSSSDSSKYENSTAMFCYTSFLASTHARPDDGPRPKY